jgi:hypothetical protein
MASFKTITKELLVIAALFCLLRYVAAFSATQSALLSLSLFVLYAMIHSLRAANVPFVPYSVFVVPNLYVILGDFDLGKDTEEWRAELRSGIAELPQAPWNIWKSGFSVSFITPELIYKNGWNSFASELSAYASLEPVAIGNDGEVEIQRKGKEEDGLFRLISPSLYLERAGDGYKLSIDLREHYWKKVRHKEVFKGIADRDVRIDHECGSARIPLATIPYEEFSVYFSVKPGDLGKAYQDAIKRRAEARKRFAWGGKSEKDAYGHETMADDSDTVEHRYCSVSHSVL